MSFGFNPGHWLHLIKGERNPKWRAYYQLLWHLGGSQSDIAMVRAHDIDWEARTISYSRAKTKTPVIPRLAILSRLFSRVYL